ncbi:T9SS type A sorting domain-containing protein [Kaistella flava (ex Peng et al. 2021)]|uniref:T9SS type A sorting domain-containing protein n=1 Tax=Kaistella flava (ex Peng et al. 2021) TaxID=2038776 RepID=A0A7M2Y8J0_9FLAO|nr:T9SS type A sorting domain-containing protein [Kaistella flava (ex Peng et al. 2021)]QOW10578.1 T9SS type A sorting domain-containing protein [Kaistella flava (ex Peng et al. 2021)]
MGIGGYAEFYSDSCGGTFLGKISSLPGNITVNKLSATTTYFVKYKNICGETECLSTLTTNTVSIGASASARPLCFNVAAQNASIEYSGTEGSPTKYSITWGDAAIAAGLKNQVDTVFPFTATAGTLNTIAVPAGIATGTYTGSITVKNADGFVSFTNAFTVTVNAVPAVTFTSQPAAFVCANIDVTYSTQESRSNYIWSVSGVLGTDYTITAGGTGNNSNTLTLKWITDGSKTVTVNYKNDSGCSAVSAASATTAVNPFSAGTVAGPQTICYGTSPAALTLSGHTGGVKNWQKATTADFTTGVEDIVSIATTLPSVTIGNLTVNTYFRALVQGVCTDNYSKPVLITVNPLAVGGIVSLAQTICSGTIPSDLILSGQTGTVISWQKAEDIEFTKGVATINNKSNILPGTGMGKITADTYFRAVVQSGACSAVNSEPVLIKVYDVVRNNYLSYAHGTSGLVSATTAEDAKTVLTAPVGTYFATVNFASYGSPTGISPNFVISNACHAATSQSKSEEYLLGKTGTVTIPNATNAFFGIDPCSGTLKHFNVVASYAQPVCKGEKVTITGTVPTGGTGTYTYQWESSTVSATAGFVPLAGANGIDYTSSELTQTTWFRRVVTSCALSTSSIVMVRVNPDLNPGAIANTGQTICSGNTPNMIISSVEAGGGDGTIIYSWRSSVDNYGEDILGATGATYTPLSNLKVTTSYRRYAKDGTCNTTPTVSANTWTVTVNPVSIGGVVSDAQTICSGTAPVDITLSGQIGEVTKWQKATNIDFTTGVIDITSTETTLTGNTIGNLTANTYFRAVVQSGACSVSNSTPVLITVNPNLPASVSIAANTATTICLGTSVTFTATHTNGGLAPTYQWKVNGADVPGATSSTYTTTTLADGAKVTVVMTSNASPCSTGSPATSNVITMTVGSTSKYSSVTGWDHFPNANGLDAVEIASNYSTDLGSFSACSCTVNSGATLTVSKDTFVKVQNHIINNGSILVQSDGNLIQVNDNGTYTGAPTAFTVERISNMKRLDYTYWGSPVKGQIFQKFSPSTVSTRFLEYHENDDIFYPVTWTKEFEIAKGYAIRAPNNFTDARKDFIGPFIGAPNNGVQNFSLASSHTDGGYNLVGNPYASNIDFEKLLSVKDSEGNSNSFKIYGTAYFWTNIVRPPEVQVGSDYDGYNYATYNGTGGVEGASSVGGESIEPTQFIKVGQGFIIKAKSTANAQLLVFNNSIRSDSNDSNFFSKGNASAKDRYWLKLTTPALNVNTILIGYVPHATNSFELDYDAPLMTIGSDSFYSILDQNRLGIQGRQYPLNTLDVVQLGSNQYESGNYTISLDKREGIFDNGQNIYLKDHQTGTLTNILEGSYTFTANAGLTDGRFEIVYQNDLVLATGSTAKDPLIVYRDGNDFIVKSSTKVISEVEVYDTSGRLLLKVKPDHKEIRIEASNLVNGIYVLKIKRDGSVVTKKIMR